MLLSEDIQSCLAEKFKPCFHPEVPGICPQPTSCLTVQFELGFCMDQLRQVGIWPLVSGSVGCTKSFEDLDGALRKVPAIETSRTALCCTPCDDCRSAAVINKIFPTCANTAKVKLQGLCLGCIKSGRFVAAFRCHCHVHGLKISSSCEVVHPGTNFHPPIDEALNETDFEVVGW